VVASRRRHRIRRSPEDTLVREFFEETGLRVRDPQLLGVNSDLRRRDNGDRIHTVRIIFTVELAGGELSDEVHGTTDHAAWFELSGLDSLNVAEYAMAAIGSAQEK
jgi:8-oxo-dGTP diphosphatase